MVNIMPPKPSQPRDLVPLLRTVQVGFRISSYDAALLSKLAKDAGVGHLTLARLVLEKYLAEQRIAPARGKGRSR